MPFFLIRCCTVPLRLLFTPPSAPAPNFPPQPQSQLAASWWQLCLSSSACYREMCFLPHRSLSSIITRGGLENDSSRQLLLTVWGLKANSPLLGKQGWWWPLLPKVRNLKNVFLREFRLFGSGSRADSIIQLFSLFSIEKMQFVCREKALLTQITCCGLNKDWLSGFSLFRNTVRHVLDSIGCTLFAVRTAIPVNEKIPTSRKLYADG